MDVQHLYAFLALAETRSFSRAARILNISQPTLTRRIQHLENELGTPLLDRHHRPIRLTPAGQRFLTFARHTIRAYEKTVSEITGMTRATPERITIGASTIPGEYLAPRLIARFHASHPSIQVTVTIRDSQAVIEDLLQGHLDLGLTGWQKPLSRLVFEPIANDEIVLIAPLHHPFARRRSIHPRELKDQPLILRESGSGTYSVVEEHLKHLGLSLNDMKAVMYLGSSTAVLEAVRQGHGLGFVSRLVLEAHAPGDVSIVDIENIDFHRPLFLVYRTDKKLPDPARRFIEFIRSLATST